MNAGVPGIGNVGSEATLTVQALQQALLGEAAMPMAGATTPQEGSDALPVVTPPADATADTLSAGMTENTPSALAALALRSAGTRRMAAGDAVAPSATASPAAPEAASFASTQVLVGDRTATHLLAALPLVANVLTPLNTARAEMRPTSHSTHRHAAEDDEPRHGRHEPPAEDDDHTADALGSALLALGHEVDAATAVPPWCGPLLQSLRVHAVDRAATTFLQHALRQWQRGCTVLLACPQGVPNGELGWLYALQVQPAEHAARLVGQRFEARLAWHASHHNACWWGVRTVKQQSLNVGRQLRSQANLPGRPGTADGGFDLALQLGRSSTDAVPARVLDLRVDAVARLWALLDRQWSVLLLACNRPLPERRAEAPR